MKIAHPLVHRGLNIFHTDSLTPHVAFVCTVGLPCGVVFLQNMVMELSLLLELVIQEIQSTILAEIPVSAKEK